MKYGPHSSKEWNVPKEISNGNFKLKKEFLKVLFSDDGIVLLDKREIKLYSTNLKGLQEGSSILASFDIKTRTHSGYGNERNVYALVISGLEEISKFLNWLLPSKENE